MATRLKQTSALAAATFVVVIGLAGCDKTTPSGEQSPSPTPAMSDDTMMSPEVMPSDDSMMKSPDAMTTDAP